MNGAEVSDCGKYRYALWRDLEPSPRSLLLDGESDPPEGTCLFVMLNPSTADASQDDPTIRRCKTFAAGWGFDRLAVANLYAYRATDPAELREAFDPIGPENDRWIETLANEADYIVAAWGANADPHRALEVLFMLDHDQGCVCLGETKHGHPRHPLYLTGATEPTDYQMDFQGSALAAAIEEPSS